MVSVNLNNPAQGFYFFDPINMGLPGINSLQPVTAATDNTAPSTSASGPCTTAPVNTAVEAAAAAAATTGSGGVAGNTVSFTEDLSKKVRKPYTITKSRESWTDQEHDKFLEALQLFDRDWKKIEAFVGSKTVIQIRSHAQKYFLKVQKSGTPEHVPPPRPKRKAAHPYPQKAPKNASPVVSQLTGPLPSLSTALEPGYVYRPDPSSSALGNPVSGGALFSWSYCSVPPVSVPQISKDDVGGLYGPSSAHNCCYSSSNESTPRALQTSEMIDRGDHGKPLRATPDFGQVYSFIGSVFDPNASNHLQRLKQMDPINLETVLLLMRNLSVNLTSPEFEDHRQLLALHDVDTGTSKSDSFHNIGADNLGSAISAA